MGLRTILISILTLSLVTAIVGLLGCASSGTLAGRSSGSGYASTPAPGADARVAQPRADEELWVIAKPETANAGGKNNQPRSMDQPTWRREQLRLEKDREEALALIPGSGQLMTKLPNETQPVPIPLKHTEVQTNIAGYIATVDVTQQYHNPYSGKIEAIYVFPLPSNAAVNEFLMTIGERKIRGIIRERQEAEKIYREAKHQGYVASLLTQERPNIFTQAVVNIEPGKAIDINIKYFHTLEYVDGWYEYVFPMVVGPRFNPSGYTDGVGAVARGAHGQSGQPTEVQYLRPDERSGHDIAVTVNIDAGVNIEEIQTRSHKIEVTNPEAGLAQVKLAADDKIPNKDFVLRYKVAGATVKTAMMTHRDERGGFFTLMVVPPATLKDLPRHPLEMVFTLDVSGSMSGKPIEQSRRAIQYALTRMRADDTFQVILFQSNTQRMSERPMPATPQNVRSALQYIQQQMNAGGGTMMLEGIKQSLNFPGDESRLRFVSMLTDGYIGNEVEILREVHNSRGNARVFSFGVGSAPNRFLLDGMAKLGAGVAAYIGLNDPADEVMADFFERISHPALVDVEVDWGGMKVSDVYPQRVPDLFVGRPLILTGRFTGDPGAAVKVRGKVGGEEREFEIPLDGNETAARHSGIASVWARMKMSDLADQSLWQQDGNIPQLIKEVALEYGLMSAFTAFVAVDSSARTSGDRGTTVAVPVPVPEGVQYETTVQER